MSKFMSDDDDETAILASATITFSSCAHLCNNGLKEKRRNIQNKWSANKLGVSICFLYFNSMFVHFTLTIVYSF